MIWILLACPAPAPETGEPPDGTATEADWPLPDAAWVSQWRGYATGLGFLDHDGDGDMDMVVADGNDMALGRLRIHDNTNGTLAELPTWKSEDGHHFAHIAVGDVDGDGLEDVAVSRYIGDAGFDEPGGVVVFRSDGEGLVEVWSDAGFYTFSCALGDIDRDGDLDLAVAVGEPYFAAPDVSRLYTNDGAGRFSLAWTSDVPRHSMDVALADLSGDGWLDLVLANDGTPHTAHLNDGAGGLSASPDWVARGTGFEGNSIAVGDIDGDGHTDVVISDNAQAEGAGVVRAWCGPALTRCWQSADPPALQSAVSLEDIDADGDLDLAAGSWWGPVRIYDNDGGLSAAPVWQTAEDELVVEAIMWVDLDGSDPARRDMVVSDWDPTHGDWIYGRAPSSAARTARTRSTSTGLRQSPPSLR